MLCYIQSTAAVLQWMVSAVHMLDEIHSLLNWHLLRAEKQSYKNCKPSPVER